MSKICFLINAVYFGFINTIFINIFYILEKNILVSFSMTTLVIFQISLQHIVQMLFLDILTLPKQTLNRKFSLSILFYIVNL